MGYDVQGGPFLHHTVARELSGIPGRTRSDKAYRSPGCIRLLPPRLLVWINIEDYQGGDGGAGGASGFN